MYLPLRLLHPISLLNTNGDMQAKPSSLLRRKLTTPQRSTASSNGTTETSRIQAQENAKRTYNATRQENSEYKQLFR